ncbi:hypothetical protein HYW21_08680 [Candidatus Woesearchaeota archaeon]|nr:hypothetical protein [Candidatus Woesearchaeota archaeon]
MIANERNQTTHQTLIEKIMSHQMGHAVSAGEVVDAPLNLMWGCEMTVYWAFKQLKRSGFLSGAYDDQITENTKRLGLVFDHFILPTPQKLIPIFEDGRARSQKYGFEIFEPGHQGGIQHRLFEMMGMLMPGDIAIGADSHSTSGGALGAMATGVGSTDLAVGILTGKLPLKVPESIQVNLVGELRDGVTTKDLILYLAGLFDESGANYAALEYTGPGIDSIAMYQRFIPANMAVELGAKAGLFPVDQKTLDYLAATAERFPQRSRFQPRDSDFYRSLRPDEGAHYAFTVEIDLGKIPPMVAFPYSPSNALGIEQARYALKHWSTMPQAIHRRLEHVVDGREPATVWPMSINGVYWGGCTNGRSDDYAALRPRIARARFAAGVDVVLNPASEDDMTQLQREGIWQEYQAAGSRTEGPKCGMCFGASSEWKQPGWKIQVTNRNFRGRFGQGVEVLLTGADAAIESAIAGELTAPVSTGRFYENEEVLGASIEGLVATTTEVRAKALASRYNASVLPMHDDTLSRGSGLYAWRFGDDINTDQMMNAQACKLEDPREYMQFLLRDGGNQAFNDYYRTREWNLSGDVIVGGHNFGCGSSRENAAESVQLSGTRGIVAGSFARIFWRNAINLGVPLYEIGDAVEDIREGDRLILDPDAMMVHNTTRGNTYAAKPLPELSQRILNAGGVMEYIRAQHS